ncbi:MAG: nuclease-related domain-containing protein [Candidatus Pacebacteria bacterium]|nr:nuclease-related domain-containing protein [Candidatus Paceibacterota bacterium]
MKIIYYSESYGSKKAKRAQKVMNIGRLFFIVLILLYLIYSLQVNANYWVIIASLILIIIFTLKNKDYQWIKSRLLSYRRGISGEVLVVEKLKYHFDDSYTYVANYSNPAVCWGDIDGILVGPKGLFLIEIKSWRGRFRMFGDEICRRISNDLYRVYKSPIKQLDDNRIKLNKYLNSNGLLIKCRPFIVLVDGKIENFNGSTGIFITDPEKIVQEILSSPDHNLSSKQINGILSILKITN